MGGERVPARKEEPERFLAGTGPRRGSLIRTRGRARGSSAALRSQGRTKRSSNGISESAESGTQQMEARAGLISVRGEPRHEMRFGQDNDSLISRVAITTAGPPGSRSGTPHWATSLAGGKKFIRASGESAQGNFRRHYGRLPPMGSPEGRWSGRS